VEIYLDKLVDLILAQELEAFSIWTDDKHSREKVAAAKRISVNTNSLNITLRLEGLEVFRWLPVVIICKSVIGQLLQLVEMIDSVEESTLTVSG